MTSITTVTLEVDDLTVARDFYSAAFGLDERLQLRESDAPTSGFRAFTLSLLVAQPADADLLLDAALEAGAKALKPAAKSMWGYGGVVQAPDGTIWKVATSKKKNAGPATRNVSELVLLLGVEDFVASKRFYVDHGFAVARSFARSYAEFEAPEGAVKLGLYKRRALAKDAGVAPEGSGSHRVALGTDREPFTDLDGFAFEPAPSLQLA